MKFELESIFVFVLVALVFIIFVIIIVIFIVPISSIILVAVLGFSYGLAIVRGIANVHGGRVTAESQEGKGSRFTVLLPRS